MYVKRGTSNRAQRVFEKLPVRDVVPWNTLIARYVQQGQGQKALDCFQQMQSEGLSPTAITYGCILKACGITQDNDMGKKIHDEIASQGLLKKNVVLGTALVSMYAKCGVLQEAQKVLDELPVRDVVSWSALIAGYAQQGQGQKALNCFQRMRGEGISPNAVTYACILKACGIMQNAEMGKRTHDDIASQGLLKNDIVLGTALVDMYAKCGILQKAQKVLDEIPVRNVVSWSALIAGYAQQGLGEEALGCFRRMQSEGISPNAITYSCILKACGITQDVDMGKTIHDDIARQGLLKKNILLGNALVDMYAKCGVLQKAQKMLDELPVRDVVSWNTLIVGYAAQGQGQEALGCFQRMRSEGISPNAITYTSILKACGTTRDAIMGKRIHDDIAIQGLLKKDVVLGTALVSMYVQQGQGKEALSCFQWMQSEGISPDEITYVFILNACGTMQDVNMGQKIHNKIAIQGLLKKDGVLGNALINMYARCGVLQKAQKVLEELPVRNAESWNALIAGYAEQGQGQEALGCFQWMQSEGIPPDELTYDFVLKAMLTS